LKPPLIKNELHPTPDAPAKTGYARFSSARSLDQIYGKVPKEQVAWLREFRSSHPYKQLRIGGSKWEYIACGQGRQTLLLLPGALSVAESMFPLITAFENEYRIIAPSYALSLSMNGLCAGIAHILEKENISQAHVFGGSYGGLVAQYFVRRYSVQVRSLILAHTFVLNPKYAKPLWLAGNLASILPQALFAALLKLRLDKILFAKLRAAQHSETEFWRAYLNETIASNVMKEVFIHQNKCLLELAQHPQFTADDLRKWDGNILIIESDDDPAIRAKDRESLRSTYPQAQVHTFRDAGHISSIVKRSEVVSLIKRFIQQPECN
jgi:pimeloyl-ACP methyl ester carboxylesterase